MSGHGRGDAPGAAGRLSTQPLPTVTAGGMMALPVEEHDRASLAQAVGEIGRNPVALGRNRYPHSRLAAMLHLVPCPGSGAVR